MTVRFRLLGPLEVLVGDTWLPLSAPKQRALLARLALCPGRVVPVSGLIEELWGADPPAGAGKLVQGYVLRLRKLLADPSARLLVTRAPGYLLAIRPDEVDVGAFSILVDTARQAVAAADPGTAAARYAEALRLWRGAALADTVSSPGLRAEAVRLAEFRLDAVEARIRAELELGNNAIVTEVEALVGEYPLRESLWELLMLALYRAGRQADALAAYQRLRATLVHELGVEPGSGVRDLHQRILTADTALKLAPHPPPAVQRGELPRLVHHFVGRDNDLIKVRELLTGAPPDGPPAVVICAVEGMAGVGKTQLAIRVAGELTGHFPDGVLFLDLLGYTPDAEPLEPADALDRLLRRMGVPGDRIPAGVEDRAVLYRTVAADRELLIVLDNARSATQVRDLLPAAAGCRVLITSRRRLTALDDAHQVSLGSLDPESARELFVRIAGPATAAEPDAVASIVARSGRLPLAVRILAARYRDGVYDSLAQLDSLVADEYQRLAALDDGERSVAAAFTVSYESLPGEQARVFRLLGLVPGHDVELADVAALADVSPARARGLVTHLVDNALLNRTTPGRFALHDLLRAYAAGLAERHDPHPDRRAALTRLFDHYVLAVSAAPAAGAGVDWLDTQRPNLLAAAAHCAAHGWPQHAVRLADGLSRYLLTKARYADAHALHTLGLAAAEQHGDPHEAATALTNLADAYRLAGRPDQALEHYRRARGMVAAPAAVTICGLGETLHMLGRHEDASRHLDQALAVARASNDRLAERRALAGLGATHRMVGRMELALDHFRRALALAREIGDGAGETHALGGLGTLHVTLGNPAEALVYFLAALRRTREAGNRTGERYALLSLGDVHLRLGRHDQALDYLNQALLLAREVGDRGGESHALMSLGEAYQCSGRHAEALVHLDRALELARQNSDRNGQFEALKRIGDVHLASGRPADALACHRSALEVSVELGQRPDQASAHDRIALALHTLGRRAQARWHWERALEIFTELDLPEADPTRQRLVGLDTSA